MLPASERMPDQTKKKPTAKYDKNSLKEYLKKQAKESKVGEDYVPFVKKTKPADKEKVEQAPKKVSVPSEFDEVLEGLTEDEIAELASEWCDSFTVSLVPSCIDWQVNWGYMASSTRARAEETREPQLKLLLLRHVSNCL